MIFMNGYKNTITISENMDSLRHTSPNRTYLASCLRHSAQIGFANAQPTSDTLGTLYEMPDAIIKKGEKHD